MAFMSRITGAAALGAALLVGAGLSAPPAQAGYVVTLTQQAGNVVANGSGALDVTGLGPPSLTFTSPFIIPTLGWIVTGSVSPTVLDTYFPVLEPGPLEFGNGFETVASSGSGDLVGITPPSNRPFATLLVPEDYVSDSPLLDTSTYDDQTFTTLGVTPGTYEWTWGNGPNQNFTLRIGPAAVPEPSSLLLLGGALAGLVLVRGRQRSLDAG